MTGSRRVASLREHLAVYLVADPAQTDRPLRYDVEEALAGGASSVQLRAKSLSDRELLELARLLKGLCVSYGGMFFVNDRVDVALAAGADGVHLGVDDLPLEDARRIGGPEFIIGYSPETDFQAINAATRGADYLGVGPVYGTTSKVDAGESIGLVTLRKRVDTARVPVIGIGGITNVNAPSIIEAGAVGVAVISSILRSNQPRDATSRISESVRQALSQP